jgi:hypothetical protein
MCMSLASHRMKMLALVASLCTAGTAMADDAAELPVRKAGVWELKTVMDEGAGPHEQMFKMCIDKDMELQTMRSSLMEHRENCSSYEIKHQNDATTVDADCVFNQANIQSRTEMSGDFQTAFQIKIESTTVQTARTAQSRPVKRTIMQTGNYLGADCGDLKPGEAMGQDGTKVMAQ